MPKPSEPTVGYWIGWWTCILLAIGGFLGQITLALLTLWFLWHGNGWHALVTFLCIPILASVVTIANKVRPRTNREQLIERLEDMSQAIRRSR
jgi:hypothetical protein